MYTFIYNVFVTNFHKILAASQTKEEIKRLVEKLW